MSVLLSDAILSLNRKEVFEKGVQCLLKVFPNLIFTNDKLNDFNIQFVYMKCLGSDFSSCSAVKQIR